MGPPMTQAEVNNLIAGTIVIIKWSGGNGPWLYGTRSHFGQLQATTRHDGCFVGDLNYCGEHPRNQVWLATKANIEKAGLTIEPEIHVWDGDRRECSCGRRPCPEHEPYMYSKVERGRR